VEDISDRLAAEESMRLAAKVFHSAAEGIFLTDPNGVIVDVNEALTRITGFGRAELLGQNPRVFKSGFHSAEFYQGIWAALDGDGVWSGEIVNRASDGSLQDLLETISVVRDDQGVITHYVAMLSDIRQLKKQQRQLERMALYDALTGLPNRVLLAERMAQSMARARRGAGAIAICYLDLDGFKQINDLHGHSAGDSLLQTVGQRMQAVLPPSDVVARLGGDEFVIVLHGIQAGPEEYELVQRLLDALVEPIVWNDLILQISASVGIAYFGDHLATLQADELLKLADQAMYEAKRHGKNRYWVSPQAPKLQRAD
jgi:diguanylate cyclase (GGDEF)-like protein/PAS domain S-box-containing protein